MRMALHQYKTVTYGVDAMAGAAIAASLMQWLPPAAALLGVIWYAIQIWESKTVQKHVRSWRMKQRIRRKTKRVVKATAGAVVAAVELKAATDQLATSVSHADLPNP